MADMDVESHFEMEFCMDITGLMEKFASFIWGVPLMALLVGTGLYLTLRFGGVQFRGFVHAVRVILGHYDDPDDPGEISHFQALCSALSGTIGLGNIVGVALAIKQSSSPNRHVWCFV